MVVREGWREEEGRGGEALWWWGGGDLLSLDPDTGVSKQEERVNSAKGDLKCFLKYRCGCRCWSLHVQVSRCVEASARLGVCV